MRRMKRARSSRSSRLRPAEGSSSSSSVGSSASARANPTIFWMPNGRRADLRVTIPLQLDELDDALDRLAVPHLLAPDAAAETASRRAGWWRCGRGGRSACCRARVMCANSSPCWKVRAMPEPGDGVRRQAGDVAAAETDAALAAIDAADAVQHAGLAGAVGADQREQLARVRPRTTRRRARSGRRSAASGARRRAQPYHLRLRRYCLTSR